MSSVEQQSGKEPELVPVREVLSTISHELVMLSDAVGDLQNLVGNLVVAGSFGSSQSLYELQCLDKLCQSLEAISEFMMGISKQSAPEWRVNAMEASRAVKLSDVSGRLNGSKQPEAEDQAAKPGDYDDFDVWALTG